MCRSKSEREYYGNRTTRGEKKNSKAMKREKFIVVGNFQNKKIY